MISAKSTSFKYIDRKKKDTIALVPGWATDYRIFDSLDADFNYLLPVKFAPYDFDKPLIKAIEERGLNNISLLGYSLGGFVVSNFAAKHPGLIKELILVSIRKKYTKEGIEKVRENLRKNKRAYLYIFYSDCVEKNADMSTAAKGLFKDYIDNFDTDYLLDTLKYFDDFKISPELLRGIKDIKIIHGKKDKIAPLGEAKKIAGSLKNAELIIVENTGHYIGNLSQHMGTLS